MSVAVLEPRRSGQLNWRVAAAGCPVLNGVVIERSEVGVPSSADDEGVVQHGGPGCKGVEATRGGDGVGIKEEEHVGIRRSHATVACRCGTEAEIGLAHDCPRSAPGAGRGGLREPSSTTTTSALMRCAARAASRGELALLLVVRDDDGVAKRTSPCLGDVGGDHVPTVVWNHEAVPPTLRSDRRPPGRRRDHSRPGDTAVDRSDLCGDAGRSEGGGLRRCLRGPRVGESRRIAETSWSGSSPS